VQAVALRGNGCAPKDAAAIRIARFAIGPGSGFQRRLWQRPGVDPKPSPPPVSPPECPRSRERRLGRLLLLPDHGSPRPCRRGGAPVSWINEQVRVTTVGAAVEGSNAMRPTYTSPAPSAAPARALSARGPAAPVGRQVWEGLRPRACPRSHAAHTRCEAPPRVRSQQRRRRPPTHPRTHHQARACPRSGWLGDDLSGQLGDLGPMPSQFAGVVGAAAGDGLALVSRSGSRQYSQHGPKASACDE
jgi:hypothetical protein